MIRMQESICIEKLCKRIYAGGDVPKDRFSEVKTEEFTVPIYANAERDEGLYGYTDEAREYEPSVTVAARGTIGYTAIRTEPFVPVVRLITVVPKQELVDLRYMYYALKSCKPKSSGTSIPQLTVPDIKKYSFGVPSKDEQIFIVGILDSVQNIIDKRRKELEELDNLIKSRFVELMSSAELSSETTIEQITKRVKVGFVGTCERYYTDDSGIPMLRTGNITNHGIDMRDLKYVTTEFHEKNKKSQIRSGDLLIARHGSNGQANVYDGPEAQCLNAVVIEPNQNIAKSIFLAGLINSPSVKVQIDRTLVGSTQHVVNTKSIANVAVRIPNIEVQEEYEAFVKWIDKLKFLFTISQRIHTEGGNRFGNKF